MKLPERITVCEVGLRDCALRLMGHPGDSYVLRAGKNKDILLDIPTGRGAIPP